MVNVDQAKRYNRDPKQVNGRWTEFCYRVTYNDVVNEPRTDATNHKSSRFVAKKEPHHYTMLSKAALQSNPR